MTTVDIQPLEIDFISTRFLCNLQWVWASHKPILNSDHVFEECIISRCRAKESRPVRRVLPPSKEIQLSLEYKSHRWTGMLRSPTVPLYQTFPERGWFVLAFPNTEHTHTHTHTHTTQTTAMDQHSQLSNKHSLDRRPLHTGHSSSRT